MATTRRSGERGAALVTVLMIVAAMSVAALAVTQTVTRSTARARALDAQAQLSLYALSAEHVAQARLSDILSRVQFRLTRSMPGLDTPQLIPVDGGQIVVTASDANNCFDLNALVVAGENGTRVADEQAQTAYRGLLDDALRDNVGVDAAMLVSTLSDWMDTDSVPASGGAEDGYYLGEAASYRTSGQPLATVEEIRAIRGYSAEVVRRLRPLVCAVPPRAKAPGLVLNINTLRIDQAPLLRLAFSGALSLSDAEQVIASRPETGWPDVETFLEEPSLKAVKPDVIQVDRLGLTTKLVEVVADVSYRDHDMTMRYLFEAQPGRPVRTLRRERVG